MRESHSRATPPRVFITYAHENQKHADDVADLARLLKASHVDVRYDGAATERRRDWMVWMTAEIGAADYVLVIASPDYGLYGDGVVERQGERRGMRFESMLLREYFYGDDAVWRLKLLPVLLPGQTVAGLPIFVQPHTRQPFNVPQLDEHGVRELLAAIFCPVPARPLSDGKGPGTPPAGRLTVVGQPPPLLSPEFRDRIGFLEQLEDLLGAPTRPVVALLGRQGIGKTAVVSELYIRLLRPDRRLHVSGFRYLSAHGYEPVSPTALIDTLAKCHPDPIVQSRLVEELDNRHLDSLEKLAVVLARLGATPVLLVLDHVDELVGEDRRFRDATLQNLLEDLSGRTDHAVTVLLVAREALSARLVGTRHDSSITVGKGLPPADTVAFVRGLGADVPLRLSDASPPDWRLMQRVTRGHPRALELVFAVLTLKPATDLGRLLMSAESASDPDEVTRTLVRAVLARLSRPDLAVVQALAALGRPVAPQAVAYVLGAPESAGPAEALNRLNAAHLVRRDGDLFYLPPDPDGGEVLLTRPDLGHAHDGTATWPGLYRRAADYFKAQAPCEVQGLADLAAQLSEIDLRIKAGDYRDALVLLRDVDEDHLTGWGQSDAVSRWRRLLEGRLAYVPHEVHNLSALAAARNEQGDHTEATRILARALRRNSRGGNNRHEASLLLQLAESDFAAGRVQRANQQYDRCVTTACEHDERRLLAAALAGKAVCLLEAGAFQAADEHRIEAADLVLDAKDPDGLRLRAELIVTGGALDRVRGRPADALTAFEKAARVAVLSDDYLTEARCTDAQASVLLDMGRTSDALDMALRAAAVSTHIGNSDLCRNSNTTLALARLRTGDKGGALTAAAAAARFSRSRRALGATLVLGVVAFRLDQRSRAKEAFWSAQNLAEELRRHEKHDYQVLEALGLLRCGLMLCNEHGKRRASITAYRQARQIVSGTEGPGAVHRHGLLLQDLVQGTDPTLVAGIVSAATGRDRPGDGDARP